MTYQELVKKVDKALTAADASAVAEHVAVQVNVTGEAEGWFYIEVAGGKLVVMPYTYDDKDASLTASGEDVLALSAGKLSLEQGLSEGKLTVDGDYEKFMLLGGIFAQLPVKKTRKPAAKKTTEKAAAKKPAAKKAATTKKAAAKKTAAKAEEAETFVAPIEAAAEAAPAKRKCTRTKKTAETAEKKPAAKKTTTTKKTAEKKEA